ncbi:Transcription factor Tfb4 [Nakaseomyces glabratus]|nr:Transcription factor Tfb4 [Nakaseomyces glabratus]KAH7596571.1 Transcription factor Tfb4 [Nakaseomyces glabratus]KAI8399498.1 Transcription factor Tfb4 [Nakaseomyces glabratus]UCS19461.1 uncharacterized protein GW608_D01771 [Nakaseomyces glabratus]UCS24694.1 uncharacterized protein HLK63_D01771 [Nakaseomyces glabratus]
MDAIADPNFQQTKLRSTATEDIPSLLTVVLDISPRLWAEFDHRSGEKQSVTTVLKSLIVFLNSHLAFNSANQVAVIAAFSQGIQYLYPRSSDTSEQNAGNSKDLSIISSHMYRRFRNVDETLIEEFYKLYQREQSLIDKPVQKSTLSGAMAAALTYTNRLTKEFESISLRSRLLVITCGSSREKDEIFQYIPIMNCIFSATKLKCPIDVIKIGGNKQSTFLQQTTDATNGVYIHLESTNGIIQYLSTAMSIDPSLRQIIVRPTQGSVDFRTSCYLTGKVVAIGYICSVCLCVLSIIPPGNKCPACDSQFDERVIAKLKKKPVVPKGTLKKVKKKV